jgi:outer membrane protein OmpA-like peptidoglycan-associated protein
MRALTVAAVVLALMARHAEAAAQSACNAFDMAASVDFDADGKPLYFDRWAIRMIVREARACRFRTITLTIFTDGANRAEAGARAALLKAMLVEGHWPQDAIAVDTRPLRLAPSGTDGSVAWTAKALIGFADPDPSFVPPMASPAQTCSFDPKTKASHCEPMLWPPRRTSRVFPPPPTHDPPGVYFRANESQLGEHALDIVAEGLRIFRSENYSRIVLLCAAGPDETDPPALALRRATAVRDALIHMGMDPSRIVMEKEPAPDPGAPHDDLTFYRHVTIDFED